MDMNKWLEKIETYEKSVKDKVEKSEVQKSSTPIDPNEVPF